MKYVMAPTMNKFFSLPRKSISSEKRQIQMIIITARKRSLGQGNVFTGVCLFTGGRICLHGGRSASGGGRLGQTSPGLLMGGGAGSP